MAGVADEAADALLHEWKFWARPEQLEPEGDHSIWLVLAGRGFGKTRVGAEWVRAGTAKAERTTIVGPTTAAVRDIMVEGESGILACCPRWDRPHYEPSKRRLTWPNGAVALTYSADEPDRLRGLQHERLWGDEPAAWSYPEAWDMCLMGLRLGDNPRALLTGTPKPVRIIRNLLTDPTCVVTRGSTYDNATNLAPTFLEAILRRYEGTRLGQQEIMAAVLDESPGSLWKRRMIDDHRLLGQHPALERIVVAVDPATTSTEGSDETGIIVAGRGVDGHGYIFEDASCRLSPDGWAQRVATAYRGFRADRVIGEANNGGDMIESLLRMVDPHISYRKVTATRGKAIRAEPVAALYEQGRIHHVGVFPDLEDQLCVPGSTMIETARGQVPISEVVPGDQVMTRQGLAPVVWAGQTGVADELIEVSHVHGVVQLTPCHPMFLSQSFAPAKSVQPGHSLLVSHRWASTGPLSRGEVTGTAECPPGTTDTPRASYSTVLSTRLISARSLTGCTSTTSTTPRATTGQKTSPPGRPLTIIGSMSLAAGTHLAGAPSNARQSGRSSSPLPESVPDAESSTSQLGSVPSTALPRAASVPTPVFNLRVADGYLPEYFANGVLVHNCTWEPGGEKSPDRLDALVWALTELFVDGGEVAHVW